MSRSGVSRLCAHKTLTATYKTLSPTHKTLSPMHTHMRPTSRTFGCLHVLQTSYLYMPTGDAARCCRNLVRTIPVWPTGAPRSHNLFFVWQTVCNVILLSTELTRSHPFRPSSRRTRMGSWQACARQFCQRCQARHDPILIRGDDGPYQLTLCALFRAKSKTK